METPTGHAARSTRIATPRLSERKKQLFRSRSCILDQVDDDADVEDPLLGLTPLKPRHQHKYTRDAEMPTNVRNLFDKGAKREGHGMRMLRSSTSSSPETNKENKIASTTRGSGVSVGSDEQLPHLFNTTMRINSTSSTSTSHNSSPRTPKTRKSNVDSDTDKSPTPCQATKRSHKLTDIRTVESSPESPQCKQRKMQSECIPTVAFYSHAATSRAAQRQSAASQSQSARKSQQQRAARSRVISPTSRPRLGINRGVAHKIRKPQRPYGGVTNFDDILSSLRNEKLRLLITNKREERAKVEEVHETMRRAKDPIKMAKPLSTMALDDDNNNDNNNNNNSKEALSLSASSTTNDFSDLSDDELCETNSISTAMELEPVIPLIRHEADTSPKADAEDLSKRKFFKSGRRSSTCMEVRITGNIRATVSQGKISLVEAPVKRQRQVRVKSATIFSAEQATVDAIIRNMDDTVVDEIVESAPSVESAPQSTPMPSVKMEQVTLPPDPYAKYRQQLPYQTNDPAIIEQQTLLLEFLITNNICTDDNFEIFIADPENHQEEAARIVDHLYKVVNAEQQELQVPECDNVIVNKETPSEKPPAATEPTPATESPSATELAPATEPTSATEQPPATDQTAVTLFPIFTQRLQPLQQKATRRKLDARARLMAVASGANQFQIDAGQKAFGARQCQQCGLVYTVHEPEEEQLHREYHDSVNVLRFKGWIDEDIVAVYPDWAADGRIVRLNELAPAARLQRLRDLIGVVDKELGYSSYIVPKTFVAYFAVRKQQIVGVCLVQPLERAHRFIQVDGTDYFSEETFEASCGLSRIWVSPFQRRKGIASKLLRAVQSHTVLGIEISRDRIAFSTPTDDGRAFARHFTQNDNFLTYDQ
ncbi:N-acetyltransferase eco [Drosophila grimshawi]|uniref:GH16094 n=1 Tax=Drosophila grimshawi TaxID=7222 RepID=B4J370_DROGR|nr:N-acetyltransferase eco [Drosophila grimshawi]EDV96141.1 GH16094 [Drosophila grimshawi]